MCKSMCTLANQFHEEGLGEVFITSIIKAPEESSQDLNEEVCRSMRIKNLKGG